MEFFLPEPSAGYKSASQRARVATEEWAAGSLYCPRCDADDLTALPANTRVADFSCAGCKLKLQLKAKQGAFGSSFANAAYEPKIAAIRKRQLPDYVLLSYNLADWAVTDVAIIPGHFITESVVRARPPLAPTARRAGWVGSTVHLNELPPDARVDVVQTQRARAARDVRKSYHHFEFLRNRTAESAGWLADVLREVRHLAPAEGTEFSLSQLYDGAEIHLSRLHPENKHIRDKIRQQLQVLRDRGILAFVDRGNYRMLA